MTVIRGSFHLGVYEDIVNKASARLSADKVLDRIFHMDHSVWKPNPEGIVNRLGWLHCSKSTGEQKKRIQTFTDSIRREGFTHILLLGMGGSSLAPEVFQKVFGTFEGFPSLSILDSTDPMAILDHEAKLDMGKTLFIVSTKSGTTVETMALFKYFYRRMVHRLGPLQAGKKFIAITDPESMIVEMANRYGFREIFLNDPDIGGRYSALSLVGMVPAALVGIDIQIILERARNAVNKEMIARKGFSALRMGAMLSELAKSGRDKATFIFSPGLASFGDWLEQLVAESTGKENQGIFPVIGEPIAEPDRYGDDRLFIAIRWRGDKSFEDRLKALETAGHPIIRVIIEEPYDLGSHCFFWELAIAIAGHGLGINPFDQPDVEQTKVQTQKILAEYKENGSLPEENPSLVAGNTAFYGETTAVSPSDALQRFLQQGKPGDYVALQAFLQQTPLIDEALSALRERIQKQFHFATSCGYGPRYLHSTGQLHKGDQGRGLFIQLTCNRDRDIPIPDTAESSDSSITFGILIAAQALGDLQAVKQTGRRIIRIHFKADINESLLSLAHSL